MRGFTNKTAMSGRESQNCGGESRPSFDLITSFDELIQFESAWRDLEARDTGRFTYFQTYDWCARWFDIFGDRDPLSEGPHLRVFTAYEQGRCVLIWPMMLERRTMGLNTLITLSEPHAQLSNVLADPHADVEAAVRGCWDHMRRLPNVDVIDLPNVPASSSLGKVLLTEQDLEGSTDGCSIMDLSAFDDWSAYQGSLSANTRRGRRRKRKKLESDGRLEFAVHMAGTDGYRRLVATSLQFKDVWLRETGKASRALSMAGTQEFMQGLRDTPDGSARCVAGELTLDGHTIAAEFGFERHGHYIGYLGAFDWHFRVHSPGKLEMEEMLGWCMREGIEWYDLLGNASTYKDDWSNMTVPLVNLHEGLTTLGKAQANLWSKRLRPALKSALESLSGDQRKFLLGKLGTAPFTSAPKG
ncbi:MAG: GNAT family N-acetyltransferase [Pseudomonadota bacterium]